MLPLSKKQMSYPKILIVGQYFDLYSGGGITMTNLFKGWDRDKVAAIAENINHPDLTVCNRYYKLGSMETRHNFPFNLNPLKKTLRGGPVQSDATPVLSSPGKVVTNSGFKNFYISLLHFTGLFHFKRRYVISKELLNWIDDFSPDIIYSQLSNIELISFVRDLQEKLKLPVVIHMMDDWPVTISKPGFLQTYWHKRIDKEFRDLLSRADVLMSISESMSTEYLRRYGYKFVPFHNPIDMKFWGAFSKNNYSANTPFVVLYAGRIGTGIQDCLLDLAEAIKGLVSDGVKIEFHIQTVSNDPVLQKLETYDFVRLKAPVPYGELPGIFAKADLLVLPNDFDQKSVSFLRFSIPTKASEYMASGTPILVYSSKETAVAEHALQNQWAYVISERSIEKIRAAIYEIYKNEDLRHKLADIAKNFAKEKYDGDKVRIEFKNSFMLVNSVSGKEGENAKSLNSDLKR
jgi:glycosyltransferase involved in cell wall biosynthesis